MRICNFAFLLLIFTRSAFSAPYHGNFLVCTNDDDSVKMTADLSDGKGEKVAAAVLNGKKILFPEAKGQRTLRKFGFYQNKATPLFISTLPTAKKNADTELKLTTIPNGNKYQLLYDRKEPLLYRVATYQAKLTVKSLKLTDEPVTCTESKWESD